MVTGDTLAREVDGDASVSVGHRSEAASERVLSAHPNSSRGELSPPRGPVEKKPA